MLGVRDFLKLRGGWLLLVGMFIHLAKVQSLNFHSCDKGPISIFKLLELSSALLSTTTNHLTWKACPAHPLRVRRDNFSPHPYSCDFGLPWFVYAYHFSQSGHCNIRIHPWIAVCPHSHSSEQDGKTCCLWMTPTANLSSGPLRSLLRPWVTRRRYHTSLVLTDCFRWKYFKSR